MLRRSGVVLSNARVRPAVAKVHVLEREQTSPRPYLQRGYVGRLCIHRLPVKAPSNRQRQVALGDVARQLAAVSGQQRAVELKWSDNRRYYSQTKPVN